MKGRVLIVAGSDSGGGAGIQADIKTVTALKGYAATAITALTAQDTRSVYGVSEVAPSFVAAQINAVLDDIGADCLKTGMLHNAGIVDAVADAYEAKGDGIPLVLDPVMAAKSGDPLLDTEARQALKRRLLIHATILTPNLPEAELLTGMTVASRDDMRLAAAMLLTLGAQNVLLKGGHLPGDTVVDVFAHDGGVTEFESPRIHSRHTHGTGCTLASAIATGIAQEMELEAAIRRARAFVFEAIKSAPRFGAGHGPLNHAHTVGES